LKAFFDGFWWVISGSVQMWIEIFSDVKTMGLILGWFVGGFILFGLLFAFIAVIYWLANGRQPQNQAPRKKYSRQVQRRV